MKQIKWMRSHKPTSYLSAILLMTIPSAGIYIAARNGSEFWIWIGIGFVIMGNFIALLVK